MADEQTSAEELSENEKEAELSAVSQNEEGNEAETPGVVSPPEKQEDYKLKFSESSKEALRLLEENKRKDAEADELRANQQRLETELKTYQEIYAGNAEATDMVKVKASIESLQKSVVQAKEEAELADFLRQNPEADSHREALKSLLRANPSKSLKRLWDDNFEPLLKKGGEKAISELQTKKRIQPETGKGVATNEPAGGLSMTEETFKKLPLEKQKEVLKKLGY